MEFKVKIAIVSIYIAAFSQPVLSIAGLESEFSSIVLLALDLGVFYLGLSTIRHNKSNLTILVAIALLSLFNYLAHDYSVLTLINGLREICLVVLLFSFFEYIARSPYRRIIDTKLQKFIWVFLVLQLPFTFYQFILYNAGDEVGGTLGVGSSGILTLLVIPMVYLRIKQTRKKVGNKAYYNILFLIPIFLNETKISFVLVPIMFLCLIDIRRKGTIIASFFAGTIVFFALNSLYTDQGKQSSNPFQKIFNTEFLEEYLLDDVDYGADIPRLTKILLANRIISDNNTDLLLGAQIGAFKGGTTLEISSFASQYNWLLLGSRPYIFFLLISGGWLLFLLMLYYHTIKLCKHPRRWSKDVYFIALLTSMFVIVLFYNDAPRNQLYSYLFVYFVIKAKGGFNLRKKVILNSVTSETNKRFRFHPRSNYFSPPKNIST